jgi:hypothetical protein
MNQLFSPLTFGTDTIRAQSLTNLQGFNTNGGTISGAVVIQGNLTVLGTQTLINSTLVEIENQTITLNAGTVGVPVLNAALLVSRGVNTNASLLWNESGGYWAAGLAGSEAKIVTGATSLAGDVTGTLTATTIANSAVTTNKLASAAVSYVKFQNVAANSLLCNPTGGTGIVQEQPITALGLNIVSQATAAGVRAAISSIGKFAGTLPAGTATATFTHNLGTTDVVVSIMDITDSRVVGADVVITDANNVTLTFSSNIPANTYRVTVVG